MTGPVDGHQDEAATPATPVGLPMVPYEEWAAARRQDAPETERAVVRAEVSPAARTTAMAVAAAHALPFGAAVWITAAMTAGTARDHFVRSWAYAANPPMPPPYLLWLMAVGCTCWTVCTVAELLYARKLADHYPPRGPWARLPTSPAVRLARRATASLDRTMGVGGGCLGLLALAILGPTIVIVWSVATAAAAPLWVLLVGGATLVHLTSVI